MYFKKILFIIMFMVISTRSWGQICTISSSYTDMFTSKNRSSVLARGIMLSAEKYKVNMGHVFYGDGSDTDFIKKLKLSLKKGCKVILGLYTSRECLLAGPLLKKNQVIAISPSCGHDNIKKYYPYLLTGVPKINDYTNFISSYIEKSLASEVVVFYQTNLYSRLFYKRFKQINNKKITFVKLDKDGKIFDESLNFNKLMSSKNKKMIVFTTYPLSSTSILEKLKKINLNNTTILGSTSWIFDLRIIKKYKGVLKKAEDVLVTDIVDYKKIEKSQFFKKYKKIYSGPLSLLTVYSYDISSLVFHCLGNNKENIQENLLKCLFSTKFSSVSGAIFFKKGRSFAQRNIQFYDLNERLK